jgi:hypothetical protein
MHLLIDALFWLALATWFGAVLMSAIAPHVILRSIRQADPTLPLVLSVNLNKQHSTLLAGSVVADLLQTLFRVQAASAAAFLPALVGKWFLVERTEAKFILPLLVSALYVGAVVLLFYGWRIVWPKVMRHRETYIENADDPDVANAELDLFDRYQTEMSAIVRNSLFVLLGMLLFAAALPPKFF